MRRLSILVALVATFALAGTAFAAAPGNNWRVYNRVFTPSTWDINKLASSGTFPVAQFLSKSTGSFAVYVSNNRNTPLTSATTFLTTAAWTNGSYETRSTVFSGAYARFWFQDVTSGPFISNDYWWYSGQSLDLNLATSGTMTAPLSDRANWSNICGKFANDTNTYPGPNCVGTTDPAVSPSDGFTNAMTNVKQLGLSFGSAGSYASGIALDGGPGTFTMSSFTITP